MDKTSIREACDSYRRTKKLGRAIESVIHTELGRLEREILVGLARYIRENPDVVTDWPYEDTSPQECEDTDLVLGSWECERSPTGHCVYLEEGDPCHDCCVFCGDPEERK